MLILLVDLGLLWSNVKSEGCTCILDHTSVQVHVWEEVAKLPVCCLTIGVDLNRNVDKVARRLYQAGKIKDLCEDHDFYHRLTALEAQFPNASVLVHKEGVLPPEIADVWGCNKLMSAARQLLGGMGLICALKMATALDTYTCTMK